MMNKKYFRLFDANLNRCREGLRVIEDTSRFVLCMNGVYKRVRILRHALDKLTRGICPELLRYRDSAADAGRKIREGGRKDLRSVLAANFRRVEESLRVLEEYGKLVSASAGAKFKKIRFEVYTLEKKILRKDIK
ncbi:MAG: thiamine-phosphate pyrophosphorylase [Elusimicrobiota bacterium]